MAQITTASYSQSSEFQPHYYPDLELFAAFQKIREQHSSFPSALPDHLPKKVKSTLCWRGAELQETDYVFQLSPEHLQEINRACSHFIASGLDISDASPETFVLSSLAQTLASKRQSLHTGHGLTLFRGLDSARYSRKENICIFAGLASHMAECFGTQSGGKTLSRFKGPARLVTDPQTHCRIPVHTDQGDVVAMYTLSPTGVGGRGTFASVGTIYNEMASSAPELLAHLFEDEWPMDRPPNGKGLDGDGLYYRRPIMFLTEGNPEMMFSRGAIIQSPRGMRPPGIPNVTEDQNYALDAVHFAASKHLLRIEYLQGDLLFFNNRRLLHGRDAFSDRNGKHRHILRLWLKDEKLAGPAPHPTLRTLWAKIFDTSSCAEKAERQWPMEPDKS
ncbi:Clavaminate synthase-like protein [Lentithecium fluviatile CBS 122367]|uniref:Clavaminate synthase-like protein n=1 Tax=Lentithecium fluviatile CBS 122367 TaxID=1168545 RepID=A0A6G1IPI9_9PLEO|nr:Clavaminate synthase-like protein [Lentithecium fluviatile CBS 122367]